MNEQRPLIDSARVRFSGLSEESFDDPPAAGETRVYTILTRCTDEGTKIMADGGTRHTRTMKVERVLSGVDPKIEDGAGDEPSLFDATDDYDPAGEMGGYTENEGAGDEPASLGDVIGNADVFTGGPEFSGGDE